MSSRVIPMPLIKEVTTHAHHAPPAQSEDELIFQELANMSPVDYSRIRKGKATEMGIQRGVLDSEVEKRKAKEESGSLSVSIVENLEAWPSEVNIMDLVEEITDTLRRYVILPEGGYEAVALWIVGTYIYEPCRIFPRLHISSPEKRCGKTTLLMVIEGLVSKGLSTSNISPAAVFRVIEKYGPTLLIDEVDTFLASNEEMTGVINSGHTKRLAKVTRCQGDEHEVKTFSTWAPMVLCGIGKIPGTIMDRSVSIRLRRKYSGERVEKLPIDFFERCLTVRRKLKRWGNDSAFAVANHKPKLPDMGNDRASDNLTPLLSIAEIAGIEDIALTSFKALLVDDDDTETPKVKLLEDIRLIFDERGTDKIYSEDLVNDLVEMEERPWFEWKNGKPMTANSVAKMLSEFKIKSRNIRSGIKVVKGYFKDDFEESWRRYLSAE